MSFTLNAQCCSMVLVNVCVCGLCLVFTATAGEGIITYGVTLYPVAFCLMKKIEERLWRPWRYLLRLVTETSSRPICPHTDRQPPLACSLRCQKVFTACATKRCVTNSFAYLMCLFLLHHCLLFTHQHTPVNR